MATYDEIGAFEFDQVLSKRLTTPGGAVAPTIAPELFAVLTMENDRPEWGFPKGERYCSTVFAGAAVAAQFRSVQLYLPSTSRNIAVVTSIRSSVANATRIVRLVGIGGGLGGWTALPVAVADFRWNGERTSVIAETVANVASPTSFQNLDYLNGIDQKTNSPIIITPGTALGIIGEAVNTPVITVVTWYERGAQPGELV